MTLSNKVWICSSLSQLLIFFTLCHIRNTEYAIHTRYWKIRYLRLPFPFSVWNHLSPFSCLNISTFSKNGMLIGVTHKLGYHSSHLIRKKKTNSTGFPVFIYGFQCPVGGDQNTVSQLWLILPSINVPKETGSFHLLPWWLPGLQSLFKLLPRALKQHTKLLPREAAAYLTLPTGETHRLSPFWCDYIRTQGLTWPSPNRRFIL